ncbi:unnamed protein product, partial [Urochloa humidicola]
DSSRSSGGTNWRSSRAVVRTGGLDARRRQDDELRPTVLGGRNNVWKRDVARQRRRTTLHTAWRGAALRCPKVRQPAKRPLLPPAQWDWAAQHWRCSCRCGGKAGGLRSRQRPASLLA